MLRVRFVERPPAALAVPTKMETVRPAGTLTKTSKQPPRTSGSPSNPRAASLLTVVRMENCPSSENGCAASYEDGAGQKDDM